MVVEGDGGDLGGDGLWWWKRVVVFGCGIGRVWW